MAVHDPLRLSWQFQIEIPLFPQLRFYRFGPEKEEGEEEEESGKEKVGSE